MTAPLPRPLRGPIVAIGGAEDKLRSQMILRRVVELAGASSARIVIIPTASRLKNTGRHYEELFRNLGASDVRVLALTCRDECGHPDTLEALGNATGVFMTGGNQIRLSSVIGGTPVAKTIRQQNANGAVVAGTSAGAAVLSEHMIAYGREGATPRAGMVSIVPGLGLVNQVIIDHGHCQEFSRGRWRDMRDQCGARTAYAFSADSGQAA